MIIKKIDFIAPVRSQYRVLDHFTQKMFEAFCRQGLECRLLTQENFVEKLKESHPDLTVMFNSIPQDSFGGSLSESLKVPHLTCLVDPPFHIPEIFNMSYIIASCDDRTGCEYLRKNGHTQCVFMPHAVEAELYGDPCCEREYDVVLLGTFLDADLIRTRWRERWDPMISSAMQDAASIVLSDQKTPINKAFTFKPADKNHHPKMYCEVEYYVKAKERQDLIKSIRDAKVHVFGRGLEGLDWKEWLGNEHPNVVSHPAVDFPEALEIMKKTKILLNPNVKNKYGAHERIFAGLACGALVLTNENPYLLETFQDGDSIAFYRNNEKDRINDQVMAYLKDEEKRRRVVAKGQDVVKRFHTWDIRVVDLLRDLTAL